MWLWLTPNISFCALIRRTEVLYCIRPEDLVENFLGFQEALDIFPPRCSSVHILCKSQVESYFYQSIETLNRKSHTPFLLHSMSDSGFDLGTYLQHIEGSNAEFFILMSASSRPTTEGWDEILTEPLKSNQGSLVGSMVSQESLSSTFLLDIAKAALTRISPKNCFFSINHKFHRSFLLLLYCLGFLSLIPFFVGHPLYTLKRFFLFQLFPNTHLRSTGIALSREFFLRIVEGSPKQKIDALIKESGRRGLTVAAFSEIVPPVLATPNSVLDIRSERAKQFFRSDSNFLPIVLDRHFTIYKESDLAARLALRKRTWGY